MHRTPTHIISQCNHNYYCYQRQFFAQSKTNSFCSAVTPVYATAVSVTGDLRARHGQCTGIRSPQAHFFRPSPARP